MGAEQAGEPEPVDVDVNSEQDAEDDEPADGEKNRAFYDRIGYEVVARVRDFYARGNDLLVYGHYLSADDHAPDTLR